MNNWQQIWNRRQSAKQVLTLEDLINLDGYDSGAGAISTAAWRENCRIISEKLGLKDHDSVFEVGCGSGAFLKSLLEIRELTVGGIDYAEGLIASAKLAIPNGEFQHADASMLDVSSKYDFVISNGVFHYLSFEIAEKVLGLMLKKGEKGVAILEVPDLAFKDESEKIRQDALSPDEYRKKYEGLEHTYFPRDWFLQQVDENKYDCSISDGCIPDYQQARFRFNVIILTK